MPDTGKIIALASAVCDGKTKALSSAIVPLQPSATVSDVGKFMKVKSVSGGKVTEYEFGSASGGGSSDLDEDKIGTNRNIMLLKELTPILFTIAGTGYQPWESNQIQSSSTSSYTDYVDITGFTRLVYKRQKSTNSSAAAGMRFFAKDGTGLSGVSSFTSQSSTGYQEYEVVIPDNAVFARFTTYTDTTTYGSFELYGRSVMNNRLTEMDTKLVNVLQDTFDRITSDEQIHSWILGGIDSVNGTNTENSAYVRTNGYIWARAGSTINVQSGYKFTVAEYDQSKTFIKSKSALITGIYTVLSDCYIRFAIAKTDNTTQTTVAIKSNFILDIYRIGSHQPEYGLIMPTKDIPSTASGVYALYDALVTAGYATRTNLATVESLPIYRYDFTGMDGYVYGDNNEPHPGSDRLYNKYQILFSSGIHGDEKGAVIYLYEWVKKMCTDPHYARYLSLFDFYVVPVVNPTGYNANTRNNYQDININRIDQSSETTEAIALMGQIDSQAYDLYFDFHNTTSDGESYQNGVSGCIAVANDMPDADKVKVYRQYMRSAADVLGRIQTEFGISHDNHVQSFYPWEGTENQTFRNYGYTHTASNVSVGSKYSCCFETSRDCYSWTGSTYDYNNNSQMIGNTITDKAVSDILDAIVSGTL